MSATLRQLHCLEWCSIAALSTILTLTQTPSAQVHNAKVLHFFYMCKFQVKKIKIYRLEEKLKRTLNKQYSPFMLNVNINGEKDREYRYMYMLSYHSAASGPNMRSSAWCNPFTISMRAFTTAIWLVLPFRAVRGRDEPTPAPSLQGREIDTKDRVPWLLWMFWQVMVLPDRRMVYLPVRTVSNTGFVVSSSKSSI